MVRFYVLGIVVLAVLTLYAVIDCAMSDARRLNVMGKPLWLLAILLLPLIGPVCYLLFAKRRRMRPAGSGGAAGVSGGGRGGSRAGGTRFGRTGGEAPLSPDDDPAFLHGLRDRRQDDTLARLEAELAALEAEDAVQPERGTAGPRPAPAEPSKSAEPPKSAKPQRPSEPPKPAEPRD